MNVGITMTKIKALGLKALAGVKDIYDNATKVNVDSEVTSPFSTSLAIVLKIATYILLILMVIYGLNYAFNDRSEESRNKLIKVFAVFVLIKLGPVVIDAIRGG